MNRIIEELEQTITEEATKTIMCINNSIIIKENNSNTKLKKITIRNFNDSDKYFAFSLDINKYKQLSLYINRKDFNKGCDGIIFLYKNSFLYILLCELKSSKPKPKDYVNQIKSSEAFVYYLLKQFKIFNKTPVLEDKIKIIRLLFDTKNINKGYIRNGLLNEKINDNIYKIHCDKEYNNNFNINHLIK